MIGGFHTKVYGIPSPPSKAGIKALYMNLLYQSVCAHSLQCLQNAYKLKTCSTVFAFVFDSPRYLMSMTYDVHVT